MARKPKQTNISPADFQKKAPEIWSRLYYVSLAPYAKLVTSAAFKHLHSIVSDIIGRQSNETLANSYQFASEIENYLDSCFKSRDRAVKGLAMRKVGKVYLFTLQPSTIYQMMFSVSSANIPGLADFKTYDPNLPFQKKIQPLLEGLREVGIQIPDAALTNGNYQASNLSIDIDLTKYAPIEEGDEKPDYQNANPIFRMFGNNSIPSEFKFEAGANKFRIGANLTINPDEEFVSIDPFVEITVDQNMFNSFCQTKDDTSKPFLSLSWVRESLHAGLSKTSTRKWTPDPAIDLRETSRLLTVVKSNYGKAKPLVNKYGFCISPKGLPMYIPEVDLTGSLMAQMSKPEMGDDGTYYFDEVMTQWADKIILVDWFNDVMLYTDAVGSLRTMYMYGSKKLDPSSEYVLLNSSVNDPMFKEMMQTLNNVIASVVSYDDAQKFNIDPKFNKADSYNGGVVRDAYASLMEQIRVRFSAKVIPNDPEFGHDTLSTPLLKHLVGIDLDELPDSYQAMCYHVSCYLRALYSKRKELELPVMSRIIGMEWLLSVASGNLDYKLGRDENIKHRSLTKDIPSQKYFDIPNVDAGGNFQGLLPHQGRIITNRSRGVVDGSLEVSAGGGKSVMLVSEILLKKLEHPEWKAIINTKGRLVRSMISEINFFSKGKVNAVPLKPSNIRLMRRQFKWGGAKDFLNWVKSLPPNTIFVTSYISRKSKIFNDLEMPERMFMEDVSLPQYLHLLKLIGFEIVDCDESHLIKNIKSQRAQYTFPLMAQAEQKIIASGTQATNTVVDMVGQGFAMNPLVFGNNVEAFKDRYNIASGIIEDDEAYLLRKRMNRFVQNQTAYKEDWAYVLPDLADRTLTSDLTAKQAQFYEILMEKALVELKMRLEGKKIVEEEPTRPPAENIDNGGDDSDSSDNDDDDEDDGPEYEDSEEGRFMQAVDLSLSKVEQFIVAPDQNLQYVNQTDAPTGEDLVSPIVRSIDRVLDQVYTKPGSDYSKNKSAVFGINKVASLHFMKYSRWAKSCVHYQAGNENIIRRFKVENDVLILVADSTSLREGENLQMLSRIFDMQAVWSPGDFEQLVSRMYRPDPKGIYNKEVVDHYWCTVKRRNGAPSINTVKLARMIAKSISLARFKYANDKRWQAVASQFEGIDLLTMGYEFLRDVTENDLAPYLNAWSDFVSWETSLNEETRRKMAQELELENPGMKLLDSRGKVLDRNLFVKLAMREVRSTKQITGSKRVYVPWEMYAIPADIHDLDLAIVGPGEGSKLPMGTYVMTEFGPGIVHSTSARSAVIELYGLKKQTIRLNRVALPASQDGAKKLGTIINDPAAWKNETLADLSVFSKVDVSASLAPKGAKQKGTAPTLVPKPTSPVNKPTIAPVKQPTPPAKPEPVEDDRITMEEVYAYLINGYPALVVMDPPDEIYNYGWYEVPPYYRMTFKSWDGMENFLKAMATKFYIKEKDLDSLHEEIQQFKTGKALKLTKQIPESAVRNFFTVEKKKVKTSPDGKRPGVDPYIIAHDGIIQLVFSKTHHDAKVISWLNQAKTKVIGVKSGGSLDGYAVRIFSSLNEAAQVIRDLGSKFDIPEADIRNELRELRDELQTLRNPVRNPSTPKKPVSEKAPVVNPKLIKPKATKPAAKPAPKKPAGKVSRLQKLRNK